MNWFLEFLALGYYGREFPSDRPYRLSGWTRAVAFLLLVMGTAAWLTWTYLEAPMELRIVGAIVSAIIGSVSVNLGASLAKNLRYRKTWASKAGILLFRFVFPFIYSVFFVFTLAKLGIEEAEINAVESIRIAYFAVGALILVVVPILLSSVLTRER